jgi:glycosyltransferase involved in cell wall biosynthesis
MLDHCLRGLLASELERSLWQLIVVDDGSADEDTAAVARAHGAQVVRVSDGPKGPAFARNTGVECAAGDILVFVDADVVVSRTALSQYAALFAEQADVAAAFGSYDSTPGDRGFVSQYRNLLHHWVHHREAGPARTFWAGCGAVRKRAFVAVGGFDANRYSRPQIEDIDLGYRLTDAGFRIVLDPRIQGTHLKRWTLRTMLRADMMDRAIPWMVLLRSRSDLRVDGPLNLRTSEKVLTVMVGLGLLLSLAALVMQRASLLWASALCLLIVVIANTSLFVWFARIRTPLFAVRAIAMRLLYYVVCAVGGAVGLFVAPRRVRGNGGDAIRNDRRLPPPALRP